MLTLIRRLQMYKDLYKWKKDVKCEISFERGVARCNVMWRDMWHGECKSNLIEAASEAWKIASYFQLKQNQGRRIIFYFLYSSVCVLTHCVCLSLASEGSAPLGQRHWSALVAEVRPGAAPVLHGEGAQVLWHRHLQQENALIYSAGVHHVLGENIIPL